MKRLVWVIALVLCLGGLAMAAPADLHGTYEGFPIVKVLVNGQEIVSDVPAVNFHGRTMVPVRFVSEALGARVDWNEETWMASVSTRATEEQYREMMTTLRLMMVAMGPLASQDALNGNEEKAREILGIVDRALMVFLTQTPPEGYEELHVAAYAETLLIRYYLLEILAFPDEPREQLEVLEDLRHILEAIEILDESVVDKARAKGIVFEY